MYKNVLRIYDSDCIIYDTELENSNLDTDSKNNYSSTVHRETTFEFNWQVWFGVLAVWVLVYIFNSRGVHSMKYVVYVSFPLSLVFIFILLLFGVTLGYGVSNGA